MWADYHWSENRGFGLLGYLGKAFLETGSKLSGTMKKVRRLYKYIQFIDWLDKMEKSTRHYIDFQLDNLRGFAVKSDGWLEVQLDERYDKLVGSELLHGKFWGIDNPYNSSKLFG